MNAWAWGWYIGVYVAVFICLWAIVKIWLTLGWKTGAANLLIFAAFAFIFWMVESFANIHAPFYSYPPLGAYLQVFPDLIPHFPWSALGVTASDLAMTHPCAQTPSSYLSATIPLSAAVICFCLMWTARLLLDQFWTQPFRPAIAPFMVGLVALLLDLYLDPVLSNAHDCVASTVGGGFSFPLVHGGLDYWRWFADPSLGDTWWFEIPIFNFAVWFSAPVLLVSLVVLFTWLVSPTSAQDFFLRSAVALGAGIVVFTSPGAQMPTAQIAAVMAAILLAVYIILGDWKTYRRNNPWRWELVLPMLFYFLYPLLALLFAPGIPLTVGLLVASLIFSFVGIVFVLAPYRAWP